VAELKMIAQVTMKMANAQPSLAATTATIRRSSRPSAVATEFASHGQLAQADK
jgi:hypothetical protein